MYRVTELRSWDLDDESTRYEHTVALPSDSTVFAGLNGYAVIALAVSVVLLIQILSILTTPTVRSKSFNLYLLFLVLPDFFFSSLCGLTCALNAAAGGHYTSRGMCRFQSFYTLAGFTGSTWMNAVIARQLHTMIRYSHGRRRYKPPSLVRVCQQAAAVYAFSAFVGSWTYMDDFLPFRAVPYRGTACLPAQGDDVATAIFFWMVLLPVMMVIPFSYVMYVWWDVYYHKLLPMTGRTRMLFMYFAILLTAYLVMWAPTFLFMFVAIKLGYWSAWASGAWSHMQGFVSVAVSLYKPDIRRAYIGFITCTDRTSPTPTSQTNEMEPSSASITFWTGWSRLLRKNSKEFSVNPGPSDLLESPRQGREHGNPPFPQNPSAAVEESLENQEPREQYKSNSQWDAEDIYLSTLTKEDVSEHDDPDVERIPQQTQVRVTGDQIADSGMNMQRSQGEYATKAVQ